MVKIETLWTSTNSELLRHLALLIKEKELWHAYLTPLEGDIFLSYIDDPVLWDQFIHFKSNIIETLSSSEILERITVLFRVRFMLYEKAIESHIFSDTSDIFKMDQSLVLQGLDNYKEKRCKKYDSRTAMLLDDNCYDEEDNGDQSSNLNSLEKLSTKEYMDKINKKENEQIMAFINRLYYILDDDRDVMIELHKLNVSDRSMDFDAISYDEDTTSNFEMENISFKHLLSAIESKRSLISISDFELRNLLSEVRSTSKWMCEEHVYQELYDAAKKVVLELRAYTEHSTAFLNKVSKREAPDYYDVIKNPMDLGTVMKKLRNFQYNSKKEFVDDLMLIWSNCLVYNADPAHFLRKHAIAMRKKTLSLIKFVPDIVIYDKNESEVERMDPNNDDKEQIGDNGILDKPKTLAFAAKKNSCSKFLKSKDSEVDSFETQLSSNIIETSNSLKNNNEEIIDDANMFNKEYTSNFGPENLDLTQKTEYDDDLVYQAWKTLTKKARAEICSERHKLLKGDKLRGNAVAICRNSKLMTRFQEWEAGFSKNCNILYYSDCEISESFDLEKENTDEKMSESSYMILYNVCSGLPEIAVANDELCDFSSNTFQDYLHVISNPRFYPPSQGICRKIYKNIEDLRKIRKLCSKVYALRMVQQASPLYYNCFKAPVEQKPLNLEIPDKSGDSFDFVEVMSEELGCCLLEKFVSTLLYHVGFEEYQSSALDTLVDIAGSFLLKLGKTLKLYLESKSGKTVEENLLHALYENGISNISLFETYIKDGIDRYSNRLNDIHKQLRTCLVETIKPSLSFDEEKLENNDSLIHGDFAEKIGEDFFGFKELGLDKEFGLSSLLVPFHLLQGRMQQGIGVSNHVNMMKQETKHVPPPRFAPITMDMIDCQIGLVQPFLKSKLLESGGTELIEDEDLFSKQKPRLPSNGKIISSLKKVNAFTLNPSKKKRKPSDAKNISDSDN
ncbi:hypothetical protein PMAC_003132 [Pneumocystis sp. 'macacae']|nr:hypothetical protein PMAC_003132 [Pneumocystis sp. 'macacae']